MNMGLLTKILIGAGVVVVGAVIAKKVHDKKCEGLNEVEATPDDISRFKEAAMKKVARILAFVIVHKEEIEAVGTVVGFVTGVIGAYHAVRDLKQSNDMQTQLDEMNEQLLEMNQRNMEQWETYCENKKRDYHNFSVIAEGIDDLFEHNTTTDNVA